MTERTRLTNEQLHAITCNLRSRKNGEPPKHPEPTFAELQDFAIETLDQSAAVIKELGAAKALKVIADDMKRRNPDTAAPSFSPEKLQAVGKLIAALRALEAAAGGAVAERAETRPGAPEAPSPAQPPSSNEASASKGAPEPTEHPLADNRELIAELARIHDEYPNVRVTFETQLTAEGSSITASVEVSARSADGESGAALRALGDRIGRRVQAAIERDGARVPGTKTTHNKLGEVFA